MPFADGGYGEGEGTLEEYFLHADPPERLSSSSEMDEETKKALAKMEAYTEERNAAVDRLCLQLFTEMSGFSYNDTVKVAWPEDLSYTVNVAEAAAQLADDLGGLVLVGIQPDDPILALYKDGQPVSAFYASYRGAYQAGAYVVATDKSYGADDFRGEGPANTWVEQEGDSCAEIARDFLLGVGMFDGVVEDGDGDEGGEG